MIVQLLLLLLLVYSRPSSNISPGPGESSCAFLLPILPFLGIGVVAEGRDVKCQQ